MSTVPGRFVFGTSSVLFGVVELISHDSELWQYLHPIGLTLSTIIAWSVAVAAIAGGIGILLPRIARPASIVLGVIYLLFSLATVPSMIVTPTDYVQYVNFFEMFSLVCGGLAVYAATEAHTARSAALGRMARLGLGVCTVSFAWAQIVYFKYTASLVPAWIPPNQTFWTILTTLAFALAAFAILVNRQARLAIRLMVLMLALFGVLVWLPRIVAAPATLSNWNEIDSNYLMTGAAWVVGELRFF